MTKMLKDETLEEMDLSLELSEAEMDEEVDNNRLMAYDIAVFYNTYNLSTLMKWLGHKLIVPAFQRSYVWNVKQASEFVDSMLRGLPVPAIFFYDDTDNGRLLVVDGQQRLRSLHMYIEEKKFGEKSFKLTGNIHPNWAGRTFDELEQEDRDRLVDALMNVTVMRQLAPDDGQSAMYLAFQRINTGGVMLNAQEIRMAVSYGPFAVYLNELSHDSRFDKWRFLRTEAQRKNGNYSAIQELILKFWTYFFSYPKFGGSSTRALIDEFFDVQKEFDNPKRKMQDKVYHSRAELQEVFDASFDVVNALSLDILSPYSKPTQTFLEAIWVGLTYRKLMLKKAINVAVLPEYISNWKKTIGEERFSELFQARRTSSAKSAFDRIEAGINYFAGEF